jgi:hypothetical protein
MQPAPASAIGSPKTKALKQSQGGPARCWLITPFQRLAIFALGLQCRFQAHHLRSLQLSNLKRWCDGIGAGFRRFWRWKSNSRGGRPRIEIELRALIRQMSTENQLWGAPRIHGELLKLGFSVAQSTVAKYMVARRGPSKSRMADLSAKPRARRCRHGFVRGSDHWLQTTVRLRDFAD